MGEEGLGQYAKMMQILSDVAIGQARIAEGQRGIHEEIKEVKLALKEQNGYIREHSEFQAAMEEWRRKSDERFSQCLKERQETRSLVNANKQALLKLPKRKEDGSGNNKNGKISLESVEKVSGIVWKLILTGFLIAMLVLSFSGSGGGLLKWLTTIWGL